MNINSINSNVNFSQMVYKKAATGKTKNIIKNKIEPQMHQDIIDTFDGIGYDIQIDLFHKKPNTSSIHEPKLTQEGNISTDNNFITFDIIDKSTGEKLSPGILQSFLSSKRKYSQTIVGEFCRACEKFLN